MNALMLTLAVRLGGWKIEPVRVLLGAAAGAAIASAMRGLSCRQGYLLWLPTAMIMMRIAAPHRLGKRMITDAARLFCAAGLVGGMVFALLGATGSLTSAYLLGGLAAAGIGLFAVRTERTPQRVRLICTYGEKRAVFDAMIDSGNTLKDYLTHLPVIVLPERTAAGVWNLDALPLRPIFAQTAGGRQRMAVLAPQSIELELDGVKRRVRAVVALSPQMSESVPALVPSSLIGGHRNSNRGG